MISRGPSQRSPAYDSGVFTYSEPGCSISVMQVCQAPRNVIHLPGFSLQDGSHHHRVLDIFASRERAEQSKAQHAAGSCAMHPVIHKYYLDNADVRWSHRWAHAMTKSNEQVTRSHGKHHQHQQSSPGKGNGAGKGAASGEAASTPRL